jgi:predicted nucleic acid-binding protein
LIHPQVAKEFYAILEIQRFILHSGGDLALVWSYILDEENEKSTNLRCKNEVAYWRKQANKFVRASDAVTNIANQIQTTGVKENDALHVACAIHAGASFFVSTDYRLLKYQDARVKICDPIECLTILHKIL